MKTKETLIQSMERQRSEVFEELMKHLIENETISREEAMFYFARLNAITNTLITHFETQIPKKYHN